MDHRRTASARAIGPWLRHRGRLARPGGLRLELALRVRRPRRQRRSSAVAGIGRGQPVGRIRGSPSSGGSGSPAASADVGPCSPSDIKVVATRRRRRRRKPRGGRADHGHRRGDLPAPVATDGRAARRDRPGRAPDTDHRRCRRPARVRSRAGPVHVRVQQLVLADGLHAVDRGARHGGRRRPGHRAQLPGGRPAAVQRPGPAAARSRPRAGRPPGPSRARALRGMAGVDAVCHA